MKSQQHPQAPASHPPKHCRTWAFWHRASVWWRGLGGGQPWAPGDADHSLTVTPCVFHGASSPSLVCKVGGHDLPRKFVLRLKWHPVREGPARPLAHGRLPSSRRDGGLLQPQSSREERGRFLWKQKVERDHPPAAPLIRAQPPVGRGLRALGSGPGTSRAMSPSTPPFCPET